MATLEDFQKIDLRTAVISHAEYHPNAERLLVLRVTLGNNEERRIVAGIRSAYTPEQLVGRTVVIVANLDPAVIRGVESQGMVLAGQDEQGICIVSMERAVVPGSRVK